MINDPIVNAPMNIKPLISANKATDTNDTSVIASALSAFILPAAICIGGMALFWSLPANAQSFSCAEADNPSEFAICNSENLLTLDEKLGSIFASVYVNAPTLPQRQAVAREHSSWVQRRNSCGADFACLNRRYQERLQSLKNSS